MSEQNEKQNEKKHEDRGPRPERLQFFRKKTGEIQFDLRRAQPNEKGYLEEGAVFLAAAPCLEGQDKCDWTKSARMKWGIMDIGGFIAGVRSNTPNEGGNLVDLVHKTDTTTSRFTLTPGTNPGTFKLYLASQKNGEDKRTFTMYIDRKEMTILMILLEKSVSEILGW